MARNLNPGPLENDLLHLNHEHRAQYLFNGSINPQNVFTVRRMDRNFWNTVHSEGGLPDRVKHYIEVAGFGGIIAVGNRRLDNALINALIERWRPETHTFHFPRIGEATVTLQDVHVLWGFRVSGNVVTGIDFKLTKNQWRNQCEELLGFMPSESDITKGSIKLTTLLREIETELPTRPSNDDYIKRARVYILHLIGGTLFPNTSGSLVPLCYLQNIADLETCGSLSWGSVVLAYLYRRLCKATKPDVSDICGPLGLLQLWAWERIHSLAPNVVSGHYNFTVPYGARWNSSDSDRSFGGVTSHVLTACRSQLTTLTTHEFNWTPYSAVLHRLPAYCTRDPENWRCETYLICWEIVEPHEPSRVMRQFGMFQAKPSAPLFSHDECIREHNVSRVGKSNHNWEVEQEDYIQQWHGRHSFIKSSFYVNDYTPSEEYISWFHRKTVQYITNPRNMTHGFQPLGEQREFLMDGMTRWHQESLNQGGEESIQNTSQQYMEYMHNTDRFSLTPSNFMENYQPVPQQIFQRAPRRHQQERSNVNPDIAGTSNVNPDIAGTFFGSSSNYQNQDLMPFQTQESMPFPTQESMPFSSLFDYTPPPMNNVYNPMSSPQMMHPQMGQSSRPERNFTPVSYNEFDFDLDLYQGFMGDNRFMGNNDDEDNDNQRPQRNRQGPGCGTGGRLGGHNH